MGLAKEIGRLSLALVGLIMFTFPISAVAGRKSHTDGSWDDLVNSYSKADRVQGMKIWGTGYFSNYTGGDTIYPLLKACLNFKDDQMKKIKDLEVECVLAQEARTDNQTTGSESVSMRGKHFVDSVKLADYLGKEKTDEYSEWVVEQMTISMVLRSLRPPHRNFDDIDYIYDQVAKRYEKSASKGKTGKEFQRKFGDYWAGRSDRLKLRIKYVLLNERLLRTKPGDEAKVKDLNGQISGILETLRKN